MVRDAFESTLVASTTVQNLISLVESQIVQKLKAIDAKIPMYIISRTFEESSLTNKMALIKQDKRVDDCHLGID